MNSSILCQLWIFSLADSELKTAEKAMRNHFTVFPMNNHSNAEFIVIKQKEAVDSYD